MVTSVTALKRLNQLRRCLGRVNSWNSALVGAPAQIPSREGALLEVILGHAQTCPRSVFSTLFTRGQERRGLWLPVYCSNLFWLPRVESQVSVSLLVFDRVFNICARYLTFSLIREKAKFSRTIAIAFPNANPCNSGTERDMNKKQ